RERSAVWFERGLGLRREARLSAGASDPAGPLFLSTSEGNHCLALVQGDTEHNPIGDHTVAFDVTVADFLKLVRELEILSLTDRGGSILTNDDVYDHQLSWSLYFLDPDGNRFELTSYEYEAIGARLNE